MLNDKVLPFFESQGLPMLRILTDRGSEYCWQGGKITIMSFYLGNK
ncbi:Uncharacterised protein [Mannheimia haemolytica]|uniref:Uncharacterized protein n=1 Tax=Mannheimia haemolytica TaxID=75985 RepID=A0A378N5Y6_MANHA|nr:Uncharacterised protein [Mannheimia haemolytica]